MCELLMRFLYSLFFLFYVCFVYTESITFVAQEKTTQIAPFPHRHFEKAYEIYAYSNNQSIGHVKCILPQKYQDQNLLEMEIFVNENMRNCGIGILLFEKGYEYAYKNNYKKIRLEAKESGNTFGFAKKIMNRYSVQLTQHEDDSSRWKIIVEVSGDKK